MPHYFYVVWPDGYIIFQSFDVCIIENLPSSKNLPKQVHNFAKYQTKISQRLLKFCQSGEISPTLVTLLLCLFIYSAMPRKIYYFWQTNSANLIKSKNISSWEMKKQRQRLIIGKSNALASSGWRLDKRGCHI